MKRPYGNLVSTVAICCALGLSALAPAAEFREFYDRSSSYELAPEHRAILEKDISRLCGVSCLYQAYVWLSDQPTHGYDDIKKMMDFVDGVTLEEIVNCAKQLGLNGRPRIVNAQYLLESPSSAMIALLRVPGRKSHFVVFLSTKDKSSTYYIDYPQGSGILFRDRLLSSFQKRNIDPEHIPVVEFDSHRKRNVKTPNYIVFSPSRIELNENKPWLLAKRELPFKSNLSNVSTQRLELSGVRKSCGCTSVELEKDFLEPGEETCVTGKMTVYPGFTRTARVWVSTSSQHIALLTIAVEAGLPFETFRKDLSFGVVAPNDSKVLFYDVFVNHGYPVRLQETKIDGKNKGDYELNTSIRSTAFRLKKGDDSTPYTKYTIECGIKTFGCSPLHAVHNLMLSFADDDGITFDYAVPVRFQVLESVPPQTGSL